GRFEAEGLAPGSYDVAVAADGWSGAVRTGLSLLAGERLEVTIVLAASGGLAGAVRDASGRPVPGALVRAASQPAGGVAIHETRTDAAGAYALRDLEPGPLEVAAVPPGAAGGVPVTVQVTPGDVVRADLVLAETGWLEGLVTRRDRAPLERASVVVVPRLYPAAGGAPAVAEVEPGGRYAVQLPAGEYRAFATFGAPAPGETIRARGPAVRIAPGQTARADLTVGAETGASALVQVLEPSGRPSPGALVSVTAEEDLRGAGTGTTDEDGFARIELEERRQLLVRAVRGGRLAGPAKLAEHGPTLLVLPAGARLTGRVVAAEGPPPAGFTLEVTAVGDDTSVVSTLGGAAGLKAARGVEAPRRLEFGGDRFEVPDAPSGRVRVAARTPGGRTAHVDVSLSPGEERHVDLVLPGDGVLTGRAVDARTRAPIAGASVALVTGGRPSARPEATTGPDGRFRLAGVGAGFRKLHLTAPGYAPVEPEVDPGGEGGGDLGDVPLTRALEGAAAAR
ncbi:MAG TPA: carboxypeptidase-like regulatory domain-containing protein, partial [Anaeromyxobacteraceae bacterium]|nr:carboxypeptidase-like regulatory domain-containing protein [Anaeromyxobacteraceae bacterium]